MPYQDGSCCTGRQTPPISRSERPTVLALGHDRTAQTHASRRARTTGSGSSRSIWSQSSSELDAHRRKWSAVGPKPSRCRIAYNRRTRKFSKEIPGAASDRGRGVRGRGEAAHEGRPKEKGTAIMKLTTTTQVSVDGVVQGNGGPDENRSGGVGGGGGGPAPRRRGGRDGCGPRAPGPARARSWPG